MQVSITPHTQDWAKQLRLHGVEASGPLGCHTWMYAVTQVQGTSRSSFTVPIRSSSREKNTLTASQDSGSSWE